MSNFRAIPPGGGTFPTKKSLREAIQVNAPVVFRDVSFHNNRGDLTADQLDPADVIVGPDPERDRRWYANIRNGKVV